MVDSLYDPKLSISLSQIIMAILVDETGHPEWSDQYKEMCAECDIDEDTLLSIISGNRELDVLEMSLLGAKVDFTWSHISQKINRIASIAKDKLRISRDSDSYKIEAFYLCRKILNQADPKNHLELVGSSIF